MEIHVKVVAIVNFVFAVAWLGTAFFVLFALGLAAGITGAVDAPAWIPRILAGLGVFLAVIPLVVGLVCLFAGIRLNQRRPSGKTLALVTAAVALLAFPFGTAFGVYALWTLMQRETDELLSPKSDGLREV